MQGACREVSDFDAATQHAVQRGFQLVDEVGLGRRSRLLERLRHAPEIWLTGMKPGEEGRILQQVVAAAPDKNIQMLSRGTILSV